jgi:hypothetical protein
MWRTTTGRRTKPPPPNATGVSTGKDVKASSLTTGARKGRREWPRSFVDAQCVGWWLFLCRMFIYAIILCSPNEREHMALNKTDAAFFFYGHNHDAICRRQALMRQWKVSLFRPNRVSVYVENAHPTSTHARPLTRLARTPFNTTGTHAL